MLQKINFTGRIDLPMDSLDAYVEQKANRYLLQLNWDLTRFNFNSKAEVWLEIRRAGSYEYRREFLSKFQRGQNVATIDISNITDPLNLRLRLKVVFEVDGKRLLIGNLDNFVPRVPQDKSMQKGFLKIIKDDSMDNPWMMKYDLGEPILAISGKKKNYLVLKEEFSFFIPAILPEVVRQVCIWAINDRNRENPIVFAKWERFFIALGVSGDLFNRDDATEGEFDEDFSSRLEESAIACASEFSRRNGIVEIIDLAHSSLAGEIDD